MTPPGTAGLDALTSEKQKTGTESNNSSGNGNGNGMEALDDSFTHDSQWTPTHDPSSPAAARRPFLPDTTRLPPHRGHRRAMSDSTIPDTSVARESDPGGFKIVITQPGEDQRPRTLEDFNPTGAPLLEVAIPSWKLGTPRFTLRGTPVIRGSSYAPTEEFRSSSHSLLNRTAGSRTPQAETFGFRKAPHPIDIPMIQLQQLDLGSPLSPETPRPPRPAYMSAQFNMEPSMFDALTFKPACDDRAIVRISSTTLAVTAATPPRLVAEITSPKFVDYELVSDFFLTFRAFLDAPDLLRMLIARLRWAVARDDEIGMVVRVRTFVALRHWILNYFMDDFVVDYQLRVMFCGLLNEFVDELSHDARGRKVQLKILAELKKCWRRVCAQYWDGAEFDASLGPEVPILPGGIAGHRDASLSPSFWEQQQHQQDGPADGEADVGGPPQLGSIMVSSSVRRPDEPTSFHADVSKAGHIDSIVLGVRPGTPENQVVVATVSTDAARRNQASPTSMASVDVISCSFPSKNMRFAQMGANYPLAAHPADPSSVYTHNDLIATTPRALMGKRVRPQHAATQHKRNNSLTDSLREHATTAEKMLVHKNTEFLMTLPYAGSLVRGAVMPPGQAFVEVLPPSAAGGPSRQTTIFQPHPLESQKEKASAMSGQGMRKLLGSVRRALSTRGQGVSPTQGNFINISPIGPRGATTNRLPGTAIVPQARPRLNGVRPPVRIDLLGAEVAEDFKKAVREDAASEAARQGYAVPAASLPTKVPGEMLEYSAAHMMDSMLGGGADAGGAALGREEPHAPQHRPVSDMGITTGSKSIVIVDDTLLPMDFPMMMAGALPAVNSSVEAFAESFMPGGGGGGGADPTPPNTPPGHAMGTPRRSSYILSQHVIRPSLSADALPPLAAGDAGAMRRPSQSSSVFPSHDIRRPSMDYTRQSPRQPPLSGIRGHLRHRSSKSYRSNRSFGRPRYASFTSGIAPQPTVRSFDATTTYSEASVDEEASDVPMPQPLRVLRRRPGGDLRAVTNVGDLDTERPLRRSRSVGSLTTYTDSLRSSYIRSPARDSSGFVDVVTSDYSRDRDETFSLGAIAEQNPTKRRELSLFSTHSSKPVMRPSFEAEAQKLAQIPDDVDDDGGVESALLKLEGKFEKRAHKLSAEPSDVPLDIPEVVGEDDDVDADEHYYDHDDDAVSREEKREHRHKHVGDDGVLPPHEPASSPSASRPSDPVGGLLTHQHQPHMSFLDVPVAPPRAAPEEASSFLSAGSGDSYSSIPLLERGLTDDGRSKTATREWTNQSILQDDEDVGSLADEQRSLSYEVVDKTDSMERIPPGESMPQSPRQGTEELSFLNDESDDDSDLSSELSAELLGGEQDDEAAGREDRPYLPTRTNTVASRLPAHPLADPQREPEPSPLLPQPLRSHPPSPPMTLVQALQMSPETANIPEVHEHQLWEDKPLPPTPDTAPTTVAHGEYSPDPTGTKEVLRNTPKMLEPETARKFSVHLPFILAFDSDILAQQFTLIEKDALNEIDWKELIEMRWKNCENGDARSWVDFLRNTDARGVEVVIARFNIMVKWAVSEIVLTQDMEERARCIIKYIHIASHCRRYRNFATMSQIAIALSSNEVSRLSRTWSMVPPTDVRTLKDLEALVSPTRNFYNLRAEMEGVGITNADMGCIPFVGIYKHDLLFNSQRPSEIASSPTTAPLVNFERCRVAASIVKTLLRLLEASTLYTFQPIEGITERCLWMGALSDEEIRRYSEALE